MNLPINKWVTLSVQKHCFSKKQDLPMYVEALTKANNSTPLYFELRIDGPYHKPHGTERERKIYIEVNVFCFASFNEKTTLDLTNLTDIATWMLNDSICVYKFGGDGDEYFETLVLLEDDWIKVSNFGQVDPTNKVYQATVEAHYELTYLTE